MPKHVKMRLQGQQPVVMSFYSIAILYNNNKINKLSKALIQKNKRKNKRGILEA